jgi:hypothetical protein
MRRDATMIGSGASRHQIVAKGYSPRVTRPCPLCQEPLVSQPGGQPLGKPAHSYESCSEACLRCGIALSNAIGPGRTFIRKDWKDGLWRRATAERLQSILGCSLNIRSHKKKKARLAHERSEDMLTWNVFSFLEDRELLGRFFEMLGRDARDAIAVFYWGCNDRQDFPLDLRALLKAPPFEEWPQSLSEPDLIAVGRHDVVFVEAKFGSANECKPADHRVDKYVNATPKCFTDLAKVRKAGYYELTRNWAIGAAVARALGRDFTLVNLVRSGDEQEILTHFGKVIRGNDIFQRHTWEELAALDPFIASRLRAQTLCFKPAFPSLLTDRTR